MPEQDPTESEQLLAEGAPITMRDGRVLHVRYGLRGIARLEASFGTTNAIDTALKTIHTGEGQSFTAIGHLLVAGLVETGLTTDEILDGVDVRRVEEYVKAIRRAAAEAFGSPKEASGKAPANRAARRATRGARGTTSRQSSSVAATAPSGG